MSYCLYCYTRLRRFRGASTPCPGCGRVHLRIDGQKYWTRETKIHELEWLAKVATLILVGAIAWRILAYLLSTMNFGTGQGFALALPVALFYLLWETASKITRKHSYFRASLVWAILLPVVGIPATAVGFQLWRSHAGPFGQLVSAAIFFGGLAATAGGVLAPILGRRYRSWRLRYVRARLHDAA